MAKLPLTEIKKKKKLLKRVRKGWEEGERE